MSLQTIISKSPLSDEDKNALLDRLQEEGATQEVLTAIKASLQEFIDSGFKQLGVEVDPNDPRMKAANDDFNTEIAAAEAEYNEEMENLSIDAAVIQAKANKALDSIQINAMKSQMAA